MVTTGGVPTGVSYVNFDNLTLGSGGGTSGGVGVAFTTDGQAVQGTTGTYAAPYLSSTNGVPFGDNAGAGPDTTTYLTTGIGSVTLTLPGQEKYFGLLWGSVDSYNTLTLYNGSTVVGSITGSNVTASPNGDQGSSGTYYVSINSTLSFDKAVATSSSYAFEFDNVSYSSTAVPEPCTFVLALIGGLGMIACRRLRLKSLGFIS